MSIKLLFADDSVTMQKVIQLTLENEKVDLLFASDGDKALALAREELPAVVVADVYMPGLDGFQLCEKLKNIPETAAIPVILISGELENYDPARGAAAGAVGHITKPFKSGEFIALIKKYSGSSAAPAQKSGKGKNNAPPAAVAAIDAEDEGGAFTPPAVMKLTARAPGMPDAALDPGEELEVMDEDIDDLAEDLDELDEEIEGEILEEDEAEAEAAEAGEGSAAAEGSSSRKGKVSLDDVLPSTEEVDEAIALDAEAEATPMLAEEQGVYDDDGGDVVVEAVGEELPPAREAGYQEATRILDDVLNETGVSSEPREEIRRGEDALEDALASLDRMAMVSAPDEPSPVAASAPANIPEGDLWGTSPEEFGQAPAGAEAGLDTGNEEVNDDIKQELEKALRHEMKTSAPPIIAAGAGGMPPERMEELFRDTVERAVDEFIASRAEEVFREEMRRAIEARFKESLDTQMEKVFREEIGRVMAAGFHKAMPRMLAIIDKITVQITPRIAQHMIKIAIERIKKGEIN